MNEPEKGAVLVTGAGSGIGKACALRLASRGYRVFAGLRDLGKGKDLEEASGPGLKTILLDITVYDQVREAARLIGESLGRERRLFGLVNSAGLALSWPLEFFPPDALRKIFEVNVIGQVSVIQAFLPFLRPSRGRIINIGSGSGRLALPFMGGYAASKFALRALNDVLRRELKPWGIEVILIELGFVSSEMGAKGITQAESALEGLPAEAKALYARAFSAGIKVMTNAFHQAVPVETAAEMIVRALEDRKPKPYPRAGTQIGRAGLANFLPARWVDRKVWRVLDRNS